jgi:hypothetical protein
MYALQTDLFISRFNSYAHNRTWLLLLLRRYIWTIYTWDPERFKAQEGGYRDHEHHRAPLLFSKHILRLWRNNRIPIQISPEFFIWILFLNLVFLTLQFQPTCNYKEIRYCFSCTFFHLLILFCLSVMILSVVLCHMANLEQALNVSMLDWNAPRKNSEVETEAGLCWFTNNVEFLSSLRRIFQSLLFDFNELSNPPQWELFFSFILKMSRFCIRPTSYIEWVQEPHAMILLQNLLSCCRLWFKFLREVCMCMPST